MKWYYWVGTVIAGVLGICTLIPYTNSSKNCFLGYKAICPFTPISTIICLAIAGFIFWLGKKQSKKISAPPANP